MEWSYPEYFGKELYTLKKMVSKIMPGTFKIDSAESSSNKCKNYLLKIYSQHINFLNTV